MTSLFLALACASLARGQRHISLRGRSTETAAIDDSIKELEEIDKNIAEAQGRSGKAFWEKKREQFLSEVSKKQDTLLALTEEMTRLEKMVTDVKEDERRKTKATTYRRPERSKEGGMPLPRSKPSSSSTTAPRAQQTPQRIVESAGTVTTLPVVVGTVEANVAQVNTEVTAGPVSNPMQDYDAGVMGFSFSNLLSDLSGGQIKATVDAPVTAELEGSATLNINMKVDGPARVAGVSQSNNTAPINLNVGASSSDGVD